MINTQVFLKRQTPTILTIAGAAGVVATAILTARSTVKAVKSLDKAKEEKGEKLTKLEAAKTIAPSYIPAIVLCVSALSCIFGANILNKKQQASIASAYALLSSSYSQYKNKVKDLHGKEADDEVKEAMRNDSQSKQKHLFYDEYRGEFFERTIEEVLLAEYHFNRNFILRGCAKLNEFYDFLGLPHTKDGEKLGWSLDAGDMFYGYSWIDFEHDKYDTDDGLEYYTITMIFPPTEDFMGDWEE